MLPLVNDAYRDLTPYVPGKPIAETERELGISGVIKLASNENPLGPSPKALAALLGALPTLNDYPDGSAYYLKQRLAQHVRVPESQLIVGNGSNEIIELVVRTCVRPHENMLFATPSFIAYKLCANAAGVATIDVPCRDMRYDLEAILAATNAQTKLIFIGNPNNPTGTYVNATELTWFLDKLPPSVLVVMDEAYFEYVDATDYPNGIDLLAHRERLLVLRTFSKIYGLAGLRVGYGVGHPELIDYLNRGRQPFNVNSLAQVAAVAALDDTAHVEQAHALNRVERQRVSEALRQRGLHVWESQGNFILVDLHRPALPVYEKLLRQGVIVRPMGPYQLPHCLRITIGTNAQNTRFLTAFEGI